MTSKTPSPSTQLHIPQVQTIQIGSGIVVGPGNDLLVIAGPCQLESLEHSQKIASFLKELCTGYSVQLVFKASFDKANRTSLSGQRGVGIDSGLKVLSQIRNDFEVPVLTDIHLPEQAKALGEVVDVVQTPAFLCRQTDLLLAAGSTGKTVNIKKGQFLHPEDMQYAAEKVASSGNTNILLCERGTTFGYRDLVVDPRSLVIMRRLGYPVVLDVTHSVQSMGGAGGASGGSREFIEYLARAGVAIGVDGLFFECHDNPEQAPSDGASMLRLEEVEPLLEKVCKIREALETNS